MGWIAFSINVKQQTHNHRHKMCVLHLRLQFQFHFHSQKSVPYVFVCARICISIRMRSIKLFVCYNPMATTKSWTTSPRRGRSCCQKRYLLPYYSDAHVLYSNAKEKYNEKKWNICIICAYYLHVFIRRRMFFASFFFHDDENRYPSFTHTVIHKCKKPRKICKCARSHHFRHLNEWITHFPVVKCCCWCFDVSTLMEIKIDTKTYRIGNLPSLLRS